MEKDKVILFDPKKKFFKFLKYGFRRYFTFDVYSDLNHFEAIMNNYSRVVFVIYSENILNDFIRISQKGVPIMVFTSEPEIFEQLKEINKVYLFDISKVKSEMLSELKSHFHLMS